MVTEICQQCQERQALNRNVMNYVKWKHRAQKSRQYLVMATIFMAASLVGVVLFVLIIAGVVRVKAPSAGQVSISVQEYGITDDNNKIHRYTLRRATGKGLELAVLTLGSTLASIKVPDRKGRIDDVILGFDDLTGYETADNPYFGSILGRVANRIDKGRFVLDNQTYHLSTNEGQNHLNGGNHGWNKAVWRAAQDGDQLTLSHVSRDGDENYPGEIVANVTFTLTEDNEIMMRFTGEIRGKASPINMAIQPYINLAGEGTSDIYDHEVVIFADKYLPLKEDLIPTGEVASVNQTMFDLSTPTNLGSKLREQSETTQGYNTVYCVRGASGRRLAARVKESHSGRVLEIYTDQPAIHLHTADSLNVQHGKSHHSYGKHSAFSLVPQNYPDAINHASFPDCVLYPGSTYVHTTWYKFTTTT